MIHSDTLLVHTAAIYCIALTYSALCENQFHVWQPLPMQRLIQVIDMHITLIV